MNTILKKTTLFFTVLTLIAMTTAFKKKTPDYKNQKLSIEKRVADLLSRMTLEEKAAQMVAADKDIKGLISVSENGEFILLYKITSHEWNGKG